MKYKIRFFAKPEHESEHSNHSASCEVSQCLLCFECEIFLLKLHQASDACQNDVLDWSGNECCNQLKLSRRHWHSVGAVGGNMLVGTLFFVMSYLRGKHSHLFRIQFNTYLTTCCLSHTTPPWPPIHHQIDRSSASRLSRFTYISMDIAHTTSQPNLSQRITSFQPFEGGHIFGHIRRRVPLLIKCLGKPPFNYTVSKNHNDQESGPK